MAKYPPSLFARGGNSELASSNSLDRDRQSSSGSYGRERAITLHTEPSHCSAERCQHIEELAVAAEGQINGHACKPASICASKQRHLAAA